MNQENKSRKIAAGALVLSMLMPSLAAPVWAFQSSKKVETVPTLRMPGSGRTTFTIEPVTNIGGLKVQGVSQSVPAGSVSGQAAEATGDLVITPPTPIMPAPSEPGPFETPAAPERASGSPSVQTTLRRIAAGAPSSMAAAADNREQKEDDGTIAAAGSSQAPKSGLAPSASFKAPSKAVVVPAAAGLAVAAATMGSAAAFAGEQAILSLPRIMSGDLLSLSVVAGIGMTAAIAAFTVRIVMNALRVRRFKNSSLEEIDAALTKDAKYNVAIAAIQGLMKRDPQETAPSYKKELARILIRVAGEHSDPKVVLAALQQMRRHVDAAVALKVVEMVKSDRFARSPRLRYEALVTAIQGMDAVGKQALIAAVAAELSSGKPITELPLASLVADAAASRSGPARSAAMILRDAADQAKNGALEAPVLATAIGRLYNSRDLDDMAEGAVAGAATYFFMELFAAAGQADHPAVAFGLFVAAILVFLATMMTLAYKAGDMRNQYLYPADLEVGAGAQAILAEQEAMRLEAERAARWNARIAKLQGVIGQDAVHALQHFPGYRAMKSVGLIALMTAAAALAFGFASPFAMIAASYATAFVASGYMTMKRFNREEAMGIALRDGEAALLAKAPREIAAKWDRVAVASVFGALVAAVVIPMLALAVAGLFMAPWLSIFAGIAAGIVALAKALLSMSLASWGMAALIAGGSAAVIGALGYLLSKVPSWTANWLWLLVGTILFATLMISLLHNPALYAAFANLPPLF